MMWAFEYLTSRMNQYPKVSGVGQGWGAGGARVMVSLGLKYAQVNVIYEQMKMTNDDNFPSLKKI